TRYRPTPGPANGRAGSAHAVSSSLNCRTFALIRPIPSGSSFWLTTARYLPNQSRSADLPSITHLRPTWRPGPRLRARIVGWPRRVRGLSDRVSRLVRAGRVEREGDGTVNVGVPAHVHGECGLLVAAVVVGTPVRGAHPRDGGRLDGEDEPVLLGQVADEGEIR